MRKNQQCQKCEELNKKYPSNENWKVKCPDCGLKDIKKQQCKVFKEECYSHPECMKSLEED